MDFSNTKTINTDEYKENQDNTELEIQKQKQALAELDKQDVLYEGKQRRSSYEYKKELHNIDKSTKQFAQYR